MTLRPLEALLGKSLNLSKVLKEVLQLQPCDGHLEAMLYKMPWI